MSELVDSGPRRRLWLPVALAAAVLAVALGGYWLMRDSGAQPAAGAGPGAQGQVWTCSMDPQVRASQPGKCPVCGMNLIPVTQGDPAKLTLTPGEARLAGVETAPAARREVRTELRLTGKVDYDETRLRQITARFPGRIDKLHASCCPSSPDAPAPPPDPSRAGLPALAGTFVGNVVAEGAPLADIYSPELLAAQEELLSALRLAGSASAGKPAPADNLAVKTVEAARGKLALLGLAPAQIAGIEKAGKAGEHVTVTAPLAGTITMKSVSVGDYVAVGAPMFTVADLSRVWIMLDAYEGDLALVESGQEAEFTAPALPGRRFKGRVVFIDPVLDPATRTARVRLEADNPDGRLKPGMFGQGVVRAAVRTADGRPPLTVPASAPLLTGKRALVYVELPDRDVPTYAGREVTLGPRAGDWYVVLDGLSEGERVVTHGNFKIDSAVQIQAGPSLMSPLKPQATCPVMGGKIDREVFVDFGGKRVYFCCPGCNDTFLKEPEKFLKKLRDLGEEVENAPSGAKPGAK